MFKVKSKEWHGFIPEEGESKYKNYKLKNMFYYFATNIPQLLLCSSKGIDLGKHILVTIVEILVAIVSNIGERGVDVIHSANLQNEAQATALHSAGAPEI